MFQNGQFQNLLSQAILYYIILFVILIIFCIVHLFNSIQLNRLLSTTRTISALAFLPIANFYVFGRITEKNIKNKLINKFTKYILLFGPTFICIQSKMSIILVSLWYIYLIYCRVLFIRQYCNTFSSYIWMILLPGIIYKRSFVNIVENELKEENIKKC